MQFYINRNGYLYDFFVMFLLQLILVILFEFVEIEIKFYLVNEMKVKIGFTK